MDEPGRLSDLDKRCIWHPFTQMRDWERGEPVVIRSARGSWLEDVRGKRYLDGVSSLWVNLHGHRRREIDRAIRAQLGKMAHTTLLGLSSVPAVELAEKLVQLMQRSFPSGEPNRASRLSKVFYSDNGSTSVEVALKMAFQYWNHQGVRGKHTFVALKNAYHGDTLGAVSVGGVDIFHEAFGSLLFRTHKAPSPFCYRCELGLELPSCGFACAAKLGEILEAHGSEIAAVVLEPLVQAAGGMLVAPQGYLRRVRELCTRYGVLLIADEVATGFGRTGRMFACEHEEVVPDLLCVSKGITGGYLPLAVTMATDNIYDAFLGEFRELKTFFHGHSYTGNPLGCAAALACLGIFEKEDTLAGLQPKIGLLEEWLAETVGLPHVGNVRNRGLMAGVELVRDKERKEPFAWEERMGWRVANYAMEHGVFIRPLGNVLVIMPPLSITPSELKRLLRTIRDGIIAAMSNEQ